MQLGKPALRTSKYPTQLICQFISVAFPLAGSQRSRQLEKRPWAGEHVGEKWDVYSWDSRVGNRAKQHHGCPDIKMCAERLIVSLSREHPDRTYQIEQCKHQDQAQAKAAGA